MKEKSIIEQSVIDAALDDVLLADKKAKKSMSFFNSAFYKDTLIEKKIRELAAISEDSIEEFSKIIRILGGECGIPAQAYEKSDHKHNIKWEKHMAIVRAVERCAFVLDAKRAAGDLIFLDTVSQIRTNDFSSEEEPALIDIVLCLKDVYDTCYESVSKFHSYIVRRG